MGSVFFDILDESGNRIPVGSHTLDSSTIQEALKELNALLVPEPKKFKPERPAIYNRVDEILKKRKSKR